MIEVKDKNELEQVFVSNPEKLVVLKFGAEWCGPCRALDDVINTVTKERDDFIPLYVNVDNPGLDDVVSEYAIRSVPTVFYMKNNMILDKSLGNIGRDGLIAKIDANIAK